MATATQPTVYAYTGIACAPVKGGLWIKGNAMAFKRL